MQYANALGLRDAANGAIEAIDRCKEISPGLTPKFYQQMIQGMSANMEIAKLRLAGLQDVNILKQE